MSGTSPREAKASGLYNQISDTPNRFANYKSPFSPEEQIGKVNQYTDLGSQILSRQGANSVAEAGSSTASSMGSRGYGGSILQDSISGAREKSSAGTSSALEQLQAERLKQLPGIMASANSNNLAVTQGAQNADFTKEGMLQSLLSQFSGSSSLDDILAILKTGGNIAGAVAGGV